YIITSNDYNQYLHSFPTRRSSDLFELASVKEIKPGSDRNRQPANDIEYQSDAQSESTDENKQMKKGEAASAPVAIKIDSKTNMLDRKSTRLNSSHQIISYAVFCLK